MLNILGRVTGKSQPEESKESISAERGLPASWYRSPALYELERRAIFSSRWILVTHRLRFTKPGDYVSFKEAGFSFFLVKDRDNKINGFHNICRHRAYPVVSQESGCTAILSCKYHGWSYGLKGNLAKAPKFDTVAGFDKSQQGLLPVHTYIDMLGFVWVNLDASERPAVSWDSEFAGIDTQKRLQIFKIDDNYQFDHQWAMDGDFNWKTLADNYNECYHCPTGHPGVAAISDLSKYFVETNGGHIQHYNSNKDPNEDTYQIASTFYFPNASTTVSPHYFYIMRCVPVSASKTRMEYEVYRSKTATDEEFNKIHLLYKQVLEEDKELCNAAQANLNGGIFINGQLHPEKEKGPLYFQQVHRKLVMAHREIEKTENDGAQLWPASPKPKGIMKTAKLSEEEQFCAELEADSDCAGGSASEGGPLAW
ncbi:uncharacterized protein EKO05_0000005 [Ascochyta rabiei]|uniref:uncharacterized protein n=1 Tax=Didymella rabiei TaxID=5454 RepID=UPI001900CDD7|nr:uncharacterized protein EKO05_0000005 [Ascochyta rabiei]UPX09314.1 hypothetical protein EKO05_0000005 [Ascochyta rabiei]